MSKYHKRFSKEFKEEAVCLLQTSGKTAEGLGHEPRTATKILKRPPGRRGISKNLLMA